MSKYGWICSDAQYYLNLALKERVARWTVRPLAEDRMLEHLTWFGKSGIHMGQYQGPGKNDSVFVQGLRELGGANPETDLVEHARRQQGHKSRGTHYLQCAIDAFKRQRVQDLPDAQPRSLFGHQRMIKKSQDLKEFMREIQRRYEVIDRMCGACIVRKGGRIDRVVAK